MFASRPPIVVNLSQTRPVVVGVSEKQPSVIRYALAEASRLGTGLRVVHCYTLHARAGDYYFGNDYAESVRSAGRNVLDDVRDVVSEDPAAVDVDYVLICGAPEIALLGEARGAQALVVGADDIDWLDRMWGGNVTGHLSLEAACPVIIVPHDPLAPSRADGVVVTIDGDTCAAGPLRYGLQQAQVRDEELLVVCATPDGTAAARNRTREDDIVGSVRTLEQAPGRVSVRMSFPRGDPATSCVNATAGASLLVIGRSHGHTSLFARAQPVATKVLRESRCPVAVVPQNYGTL